MPITCLAPAKLNLFLHITSRRADGYHCLQTLFQLLDYGDELQFSLRTDGELSRQSTTLNLPAEHDLTLRAARLLKQFSGTTLGADIHVNKRIPLGGGLGGGSSDAATTLLALNELWQLQLPRLTLAQLGLKLGADVPVFVYGQTAWAEGVGEILTPVALPEQWYLVIHPHCQVPTAEIFAAPELVRNQLPVTINDFLAGHSQNVCEAVVCQRYPAVGEAIAWLQRYRPARMTGTGACVFANFVNLDQAHAVLAKLPNSWYGFVAQGKNTPSIFLAD